MKKCHGDGKMGIRSIQKEQRRQQILFCCLDLFVHKGYNGTTVRDIAQKVGMSVGLLFHYFPTKQAILEELLKFAQSGVSSVLELMNQPISPIECFEQIANEIFKSFRESPISASIFMLVNQTITSDWAPESVKNAVQSLSAIEQTVPIIVKGQQLGCIKQGDPVALSMAFWSSIQGVAEGLACFPNLPVPESSWIVDIVRL